MIMFRFLTWAVLCFCSTPFLLFSKEAEGSTVIICVSDWHDYTLSQPKDPKNSNHQLGYMADLVKAAFANQSYDVEYLWVPANRGFQKTKSGKADAFLGAFESETKGYIGNKEPIGILRSHYLVSQKENWRYTGYDSLFKAKAIGIWAEYDYIDPVFSKYFEAKPKNLYFLPNEEDAVERVVRMVNSGRLTAIVGDPGSFNWYAKQHQKESLVDAGQCLKPEFLYAGFTPAKPKRSKLLSKILDEGIVSLRSNGKLEQLLKPYSFQDWSTLKVNSSEAIKE
jgi:ABC-type amino acid transport substrate-binding protein